MSIRETFTNLFKRTTKTAEGASFALEQLCQCSPAWPGLETTANGYVLPAEASTHYSIMTNPDIGLFVARCTGCQAQYPHPWVIPQGAPMPFDWAQE